MQRNFVIFEAELPNPNPSCGIEGCRHVVDFWIDLTEEEDTSVRAQRLKDFYFDGIPAEGVAPVFQVANYSPGSGQIRTNQFLNLPSTLWQLREFKLAVLCDPNGNDCELQFLPVTVKENPFAGLFADDSTDPRTADFRQFFISQIPALAGEGVNDIVMQIPDRFNSGQSTSQSSADDYRVRLNPSGAFAAQIQTGLDAIGSALTPSDIAARATTQSCAGCHQLNSNVLVGGGVRWPGTLGFVHTAEGDLETGPDGPRFRVSAALSQEFIPHRRQVMLDFLTDGQPCNATSTESTEQLLLKDQSNGPPQIRVRRGKHGQLLIPSATEISRLDKLRKVTRPATAVGGRPARSH